MGIYDRNYMKEERRLEAATSKRVPRTPTNRAPLWTRIKFRLWLLFHPSKR